MPIQIHAVCSVESICDTLQRNLFQGNREDWGAETENIYQALETLATKHGQETIKLPQSP